MPTFDDGVPVYGADEAANLTVITGGIADALAGRKNRRCSSISDMYSKIAALDSGDRPGSMWFVDGKGWYGHDGTNPWKIPQPGLDYQAGIFSGTTDVNGLIGIGHTLGVSALDAHFTPIYAGADDLEVRSVMGRIQFTIREFLTNQVILYVADATASPGSPAAVASKSMMFCWRFEKFAAVP